MSGKINWAMPIQFNDGREAFYYGSVHGSGKLVLHNALSSHSDAVSELHQMGVRHLVCTNAERDGAYFAFNENGNPIDIYCDELFGKPVKSMTGKSIEQKPIFRVEQMEDAEETAGELWGAF